MSSYDGFKFHSLYQLYSLLFVSLSLAHFLINHCRLMCMLLLLPSYLHQSSGVPRKKGFLHQLWYEYYIIFRLLDLKSKET